MKRVSQVMREMGIQVPSSKKENPPQFHENRDSRRFEPTPVCEHGCESRGGLNGKNNITRKQG